ncbi:hypothetical protein DFQ28_009614 [Apophysomyces sp. BC1034]|nr:hypothetical protein DFQ29_007946 [Apophysomyces sp. BC1021]KAG0185284.1 hypothetical protein DFQ28_009614 [Apophysomyces sp. BC1034]
MTVQDPRLKFPQKVPPRTNTVAPEADIRINHIVNQWPQDVAFSDIWEASAREHVLENKPTEHALNKRREKSATSKLEPTSNDSQIPIILIQRGNTTFHGLTSQNPLSNAEVLEGWTLILPRGWGNAFWKSFVFAGARTGGFENIRQMQFESGFGCYPFDFPGTKAYENFRAQLKKSLEIEWSQKPPAKRVNHTKLGVDHPFEAAFEYLGGNVEDTKCWLLQGERLISTFLDGGEAQMRLAMETMLSKRGIQCPQFRLEDALFKVRVTYLDRRKPMVNAMVYLVEDQKEYNSYASHQKASKKSVAQNIYTHGRKHIGYLTNGGFSLTTGCGFGVGACTITGVRAMRDIDQRQKRKVKMMVLVQNPNSVEGWPAQLEILG